MRADGRVGRADITSGSTSCLPLGEGVSEHRELTEGGCDAKEPPRGGSLPTALALPILGSFCMKVY